MAASCAVARSARFCASMSRAISDAAMTVPSHHAPATGQRDADARPSFVARVVSKCRRARRGGPCRGSLLFVAELRRNQRG
jgi:hypothetical protein